MRWPSRPHSLQAATRAWRDGADTDWIACALLHDIGDIYAPYNHDEYAASIVKPFVREQCTWVVEKHGDFQRLYYAQHTGGNPHARDRFKGHPYYDDCDAFCAQWDQSSFDPGYDTLPMDFFRPFVLEVFARGKYVWVALEQEPVEGHDEGRPAGHGRDRRPWGEHPARGHARRGAAVGGGAPIRRGRGSIRFTY